MPAKKVITTTKVQKVADAVCKQYKVASILIKFTNTRSAKGGACYRTFRYRGSKINHAKDIMIYEWDSIRKYPGEVIHRLSHELTHHIRNMKKNSLRHDSTFYNLEEKVGLIVSKKMR